MRNFLGLCVFALLRLSEVLDVIERTKRLVHRVKQFRKG